MEIGGPSGLGVNSFLELRLILLLVAFILSKDLAYFDGIHCEVLTMLLDA